MPSSANEVGADLVPVEGLDSTAMGPVDFAKYLCDKGSLTTEQRGPVPLLARDMQISYVEEVSRRATLTDAQLRAEAIGATEHVTLPLKGRRLRLLLFGGGGCGKPGSSITCLPSSFAVFMETRASYTRPSSTKHHDSSTVRQVILSRSFEGDNLSLWPACACRTTKRDERLRQCGLQREHW